MKQLVFMIASTIAGTLGVYTVSPILGVFVYYMFAVLRPQYMWKWSLPEGITWSYFVALATIGAAIMGSRKSGNSDGYGEQAQRPSEAMLRVHWCMLCFALWIGVTVLMARNMEAAYPWFEEYAKIFVMYFVSAGLVCKVRHVWALFLMTALVLAYIAYEVNYLYLVNHRLNIYSDGYGGLDNNGAGLMLAMGMPLCWFCFEGVDRWWRWGFLVLIPVIVHAVLMTFSRGAMLSLCVGCIVLGLRSRRRGQLAIVLIVFLVGLIPVMAGPEISARFLTIRDNDVDDSANSRRQSWAAAFKIAADNPVFGVGVRNANLLSQRYGADVEGRTIHSQYLQIAADNGFVGLSLYLGVFAVAWLRLRDCRRSLGELPENVGRRVAAMAGGLEGALVVFGFGSAFLSLEVFELPYLVLLLAVQLGAITRVGRVSDDLLEVDGLAESDAEVPVDSLIAEVQGDAGGA